MFKHSTKTYFRNPDFPWQTIDEETIIVDPKAQNSFELNPVGSFVWNTLDGQTSGAEILAKVCASFDVGAEQAENDLNGWFDEMKQNQLVRESE